MTAAALTIEKSECHENGYHIHNRFLGKGKYATVWLAEPHPETMKKNYKLRTLLKPGQAVPKVAIKVINLETSPKRYVKEFLPQEVSTMSICYGHPNVIKLLDFFVTERRVYIVMEYAECGNLLHYLTSFNKTTQPDEYSSPGGISEQHAKDIFRDVISAVRHVHSKGVAHRDLKLENILLAEGNVPKLSDFGFAVKIDQNDPLLRKRCGSYSYVAPEVLTSPIGYDGKRADVWSLGVILFAIVEGFLPFEGINLREILESISEPLYLRSVVSDGYAQLIEGMLNPIPEKRLTTEEMMKTDWLRERDIIYDSSDDEESQTAALEMNKRKKIVLGYKPNKLDDVNYVASRIESMFAKLPPLPPIITNSFSKPTKPILTRMIDCQAQPSPTTNRIISTSPTSHAGAGDGAPRRLKPLKFQPKPPSTPPPSDRKQIGKRRLQFRPSGSVRRWSEGDDVLTDYAARLVEEVLGTVSSSPGTRQPQEKPKGNLESEACSVNSIPRIKRIRAAKRIKRKSKPSRSKNAKEDINIRINLNIVVRSDGRLPRKININLNGIDVAPGTEHT